MRALPTRATLRLTPADFALYRAYLEGLDEATLHTHYGVPGTDVRVTRRTLALLSDTLTIAARRAGDVDAAHLLRLKSGSLPRDAHAGGAEGPAAGREVPTLEAFRAEVDPDAFYSERELVALYVETYPPASSPALDQKDARNGRLRDRQDAALALMEASLVEAPQPEHAPAAAGASSRASGARCSPAWYARLPAAVKPCCRYLSRTTMCSIGASSICWSRSL
ncbi:hypothetical protein [Burkholderia cenocepacia]|uniref:hypothetical protein n=1 Tax=Burkholderia cenocepacia TaxID=95486 RepID=UPI002938E285|nr:hypothetical protein [Burkholderia cenocepacia]